MSIYARLAGIMEEVRELCGGEPVTITSGYRNAEVNALVGGAVDSAHITGLACRLPSSACGTPLEVSRS